MNANAVEVAWAAGVFEGEGSIVPTHRHSIRLQLHMTDEDVVCRFAAVVGAGEVHSLKRGSNKTIYYWSCGRFNKVTEIIIAMWPWLGARRRARWNELTVAYQEHRASALCERECIGCGQTFWPAKNKQARSQKWCAKECRQAHRVYA